jgi:hypothetical protein
MGLSKVDDRVMSFVLFCAVRGIDLSKQLEEFSNELAPKEEHNGLTFDEWHRLVGMMSYKIIELQKFLEGAKKGSSLYGKTTQEVYPTLHDLLDKLVQNRAQAAAKNEA